MELPLEKKKELVFHGFAFIMDVCTVDGNLVISAEEKETGDRWKGQVSTPCATPPWRSRSPVGLLHLASPPVRALLR